MLVCARCGVPLVSPCSECGLDTGASIWAETEAPSRILPWSAGAAAIGLGGAIVGLTAIGLAHDDLTFAGESRAAVPLFVIPALLNVILGVQVLRGRWWAALTTVVIEGILALMCIGAAAEVDRSATDLVDVTWLAKWFSLVGVLAGVVALLGVAALVPMSRHANHRRWLAWQASKPQRT